MKIGIISINAHTKVLNFASPIHSYAFQQFLLKNGIESTIIDYKPVYYGKFDVRHPLFYYVDHPNASEKQQKTLLKKWKNLFYEREVRYDRFEEFINKYYIKTPKCYNPKLLDKETLDFDCYISATDTIWKNNKNTGFDKGYLLASKCMEGKKKICYAASKGASAYSKNQDKELYSYISDYDYISLRETSLQQYVKSITGMEFPHVIDPVFLHDKEFYYNITNRPEKKGYVLLYIVMEKAPELVKKAVAFAQEQGLDVIELSEDMENAKLIDGTTHEVIYGIGIEEWLGYMANADYIFTNSFHGCCFSIIYQKQFFVGARSGDKIDSLLDMFELSWRRIADNSNGTAAEMQDIDYDRVDEMRHAYVKASGDFILNAIHDLENREHRPLCQNPQWTPRKGIDEPIEEEPEKPVIEANSPKTPQASEAVDSLDVKVKRKLKKIIKSILE